MTLKTDRSENENQLIINFDKLLNLNNLKLPPVPVEYLKISLCENSEKFSSEPIKNNDSQPFQASSVYKSYIKSANILTRGDDVKEILEIEFENKKWDFQPGDTISILPKNSLDEVDYVIERLNLCEICDKMIKISSLKSNKPVPKFLPESDTIRNILLCYLDFRAIPKKGFLRCLSTYTKSDQEKATLEVLSSIQGAEYYKQMILDSKTTFIDLLKQFPSCTPPFERLLEHLPRLMPRPYSICTSPLDNQLKIILSVVNYKQNGYGVCSGWLKKLVERKSQDLTDRLNNLSLNYSNEILFYFRNLINFRLPSDNSTPIIMIGPGTGVAPFLGFLKHRQKQFENDPTIQFGEMWLFYGCRYSNRNYICKQLLNEMLDKKILTKLHVSYSRESSDVKYVQDNLKLCANELFNLIHHNNAIVYVCGDGRQMAVDVKNVIINLIGEYGGLSIEDAGNYVSDMMKNLRYLEDVWS